MASGRIVSLLLPARVPFVVLAALLLLAPAVPAQDQGGADGEGRAFTRVDAYNVSVSAFEDAAVALEQGDRAAAAENVTAARALVNTTFRRDFEKASPLSWPALEGILARADAALAAEDAAALRRESAALAGALAAGAFYAFEAEALAGGYARASSYLAILSHRYALDADSALAVAWEAALASRGSYLLLASKAVGRAPDEEGAFDLLVQEVATAALANDTHAAVAARYVALGILPEVAARSGNGTADALAAGLADLARGIDKGAAERVQGALLVFLEPRAHVALHLRIGSEAAEADGSLAAAALAQAEVGWARERVDHPRPAPVDAAFAAAREEVGDAASWRRLVEAHGAHAHAPPPVSPPVEPPSPTPWPPSLALLGLLAALALLRRP